MVLFAVQVNYALPPATILQPFGIIGVIESFTAVQPTVIATGTGGRFALPESVISLPSSRHAHLSGYKTLKYSFSPVDMQQM